MSSLSSVSPLHAVRTSGFSTAEDSTGFKINNTFILRKTQGPLASQFESPATLFYTILRSWRMMGWGGGGGEVLIVHYFLLATTLVTSMTDTHLRPVQQGMTTWWCVRSETLQQARTPSTGLRHPNRKVPEGDARSVQQVGHSLGRCTSIQ